MNIIEWILLGSMVFFLTTIGVSIVISQEKMDTACHSVDSDIPKSSWSLPKGFIQCWYDNGTYRVVNMYCNSEKVTLT